MLTEKEQEEAKIKFENNTITGKEYFIEDYDICADVPTYYSFKNGEYYYTTLRAATAFSEQEALIHLENIKNRNIEEKLDIQMLKITKPTLEEFLKYSETDLEYDIRNERMKENNKD